MDFEEFSGKTVEDAITEACTKFTVTSDRLDYEVVDKGSSGFLGLNSHLAIIKARVKNEESDFAEKTEKEITSASEINENKETVAMPSEEKNEDSTASNRSSDFSEEKTDSCIKNFLNDVFKAMDMEVTITTKFNKEENSVDVDLEGKDMGVLIGKRGQTLDSLQYLLSLVVNKESSDYIRVKVDTENYRKRRKETLENLAKNLSYKVKRTRRSVSLEPMNPYERRIIHSALQNDKFVTTHSEGEEPFRRVVITLKRQG